MKGGISTANVNTYAKLIPPPMFRPEDETVFRVEYSGDLMLMYATLVIDGYEEADYPSMSRVYTGTRITQELHISQADHGYTQFTVPGGTLGFSPDSSTESVLHTGKMKARVLFGESAPGGHVTEPVFTSNETYVDMLVMADTDFRFIGTPYTSHGSVFLPDIFYIPNYDFGSDAGTDIRSYRFFLYDSEKRLITDSGELYDWDTAVTSDKRFAFRGLEDGCTYYTRARVVLCSGYTLTTDYEPINVIYDAEPEPSARVSLRNIPQGVEIRISAADIPHDRTVVSRTVRHENEYLMLLSQENTGNTVFTDSYAIPGTEYLYTASLFNGDEAVGSFSAVIKHESGVVRISGRTGCYTAVGNISKHPIDRNDRGRFVGCMDGKYPVFVVNGQAQYDSGRFEGVFALTDDCAPVTDNTELSAELRSWLSDGKAKLLTFYTGESWIVCVSDVRTDDSGEDMYFTSFRWTQTGDAHIMSEYTRTGLVADYD